ncbi:hypothetical protein [Kingella oralis]|uniref:hypothetical protein n=1 Tax=Kingella oralis TaxID=505 RepID=UPI0034E5985B
MFSSLSLLARSARFSFDLSHLSWLGLSRQLSEWQAAKPKIRQKIKGRIEYAVDKPPNVLRIKSMLVSQVLKFVIVDFVAQPNQPPTAQKTARLWGHLTK